MKKSLTILFVFAFIFATALPGYCGTEKVITLNDGTVLKGKVIKFSKGVYTIDTKKLGRVQIEDYDVESIATPRAATAQQNVVPTGALPAMGMGGGLDSQLMQRQIQQLQGSILSNPSMMGEVQKLMQDKQIQAIMADPNFVNDIMSMDPNRIQQNKYMGDLLNNPTMMNLIKQLQQSNTLQR